MYLSNTIDSLIDSNKDKFIRKQWYSDLLHTLSETFKEFTDTEFVIEKFDEFGTKLIISTQGILFLFSHLQEKFLSSDANNTVELTRNIKKNNINLGIIFSFKIFYASVNFSL